MGCALLVLEQPWSAVSDDPQQTSLRPMFEFLEKISEIPVFHAQFYDESSLERALFHLVDAACLEGVSHLMLYIAGHGKAKNLYSPDGCKVKLTEIFRLISLYGTPYISGLILDACDLGQNRKVIEDGIQDTELRWVFGYEYSVDFVASTLINFRLISEVGKLPRHKVTSSKILKKTIQKALNTFNLDWPIAYSDKSKSKIALRDSVCAYLC